MILLQARISGTKINICAFEQLGDETPMSFQGAGSLIGVPGLWRDIHTTNDKLPAPGREDV